MLRSPLSRANRLALGLVGTGATVEILEKLAHNSHLLAAHGWVGPLAVGAVTIGTTMAHIGSDLVANWIHGKAEAHDAALHLLTNNDIALAQAAAIKARLLKLSPTITDSTQRKRLERIADGAHDWWLKLVHNPLREEPDPLRDAEFLKRFAEQLTGRQPVMIAQATWEDLLREADYSLDQTRGLDDEWIKWIGSKLSDDLGQDFVETIKADFESGGKAYAAMSLRFFSEILCGVQAASESNAALIPLVEKLPDLLGSLQQAIAALRRTGLPAEIETSLATTERNLTNEVQTLRREMHERNDKLEQLMTELRREFAAKGVNLTDLPLAELENELAKRVRNLTAQDLHRLIGYARRKFDITRIVKYSPAELIGRDDEKKLLSNAWDKAVREETNRPCVLTFVAMGGEGKTSLMAKWVVDEMLAKGWPGCDAAFAWSFYSQGTREQLAASSDLFLKEALTFFGDDADKAFAASPAGAFEKGQRLARLVGQRRSLLILDGLEPLQYAPTSPTPGQLKDQGLAALLKGLATTSHGLCVVTTRYSLPDLKAFWQTTAPEVKLLRLSREAGGHLLKTLGVNGTAQEFATLVEDVKGHALTLTLLGGFLKRAFHGDIRQRDRVKFEKADEKMDGGHAFRTMAAYEQWLLRDGGDEGRREVAVLRLMGLFDRPADAGCLAALRSETIPGLTEPLAGLADDDWEYCLSGLEAAKLLTVNRDASGALVSLDAHPHLREYFARQLRAQQPDAWRAAHRRLYEHLCETTPDKPQPTLEDLQPLYQAVAHGCQAGQQQEACDNVYRDRIMRGREAYPVHKLGAHGSELAAIASFFEQPWSHISPALIEPAQAWLLNEAACRLRALGRLTESVDPMRAGIPIKVRRSDWRNAAQNTANLSELELTLGEVAGAVGDAEQSVTYADRSSEAFERMAFRPTHANALDHAGRRAEAETRFCEAEQMQKEWQPDYPLLYSVQGFQYCDLLLAAPERAAWGEMLKAKGKRLKEKELVTMCRAVEQRAAQTLKWAEQNRAALLSLALDHLTLGRAALYRAILEKSAIGNPKSEIENAVAGLRRAGTTHHIPRALLTRAWLRFLTGARTGPESAQADLDEAWEIAERGPMKLFLADIHLHRARLFGRLKAEGEMLKYPWESPATDLAAAEKLINDCGYHRRDEELADAKEAAKNWE